MKVGMRSALGFWEFCHSSFSALKKSANKQSVTMGMDDLGDKATQRKVNHSCIFCLLHRSLVQSKRTTSAFAAGMSCRCCAKHAKRSCRGFQNQRDRPESPTSTGRTGSMKGSANASPPPPSSRRGGTQHPVRLAERKSSDGGQFPAAPADERRRTSESA